MKRQSLDNLYFLGFSVAIGILAAIGALFFRSLIEIFQNLFWASGSTFLEKLINSPWWLKILVPVAGGLIAGPIITFWAPEAKGPGVPEVILSVARRQSTIRHRVTFLKSLVSSLLIGCGASVGREGPIVQIGASVGSSVAQVFRLSPDLRRVCLASGAAAGIAATFNAPIAGTFFAVEIILMEIEIAHISHIIISSIVASVLSRIFWGEFPAFIVAPFQLTNYWELSIYLALGLLAGVVAIFFVRLTYAIDGLFCRLRIAEWIKPAIGGLLLGLIALKLPHVMGVGYETVNLSLAGSLGLKMAVLLLFAKILATSLSIGSGMSGGIFAPSLVLGATLGTIVGIIANYLLPDLTLSPCHYALAGMGAVVAGATLAPITAILTIFELTYSYQIILPLMVACITSAIIVRLLFGYSGYEIKLLKQGINIVRGHDVGILRNLRATDFMSKEFETLRDSTTLQSIADQVIQSPYPHFVVLNQRDELAGVLSLRDLRASLDKFEELKKIVVADDLMTKKVITLSAEDNLEAALHLFESHRVSFVPITDSANPKKVIGILKKDDLLQAYEERVLKDRILSLS
ncbi:MAG: chloride channel protein [Thermodesulfobacteriota bacterium]|nr:chloride channel protein [Thermodesulfobacteriota bacterium]